MTELDILLKHGFEEWKIPHLHFIYKKVNGPVVTLIHWDADYYKDVDKDIVKTFENENGLASNIVTLYTPDCRQNWFGDLNTRNFRSVFLPELLFLEVQRWVDFDNLPILTRPRIQRKFMFLNNRSMSWRKGLFQFFQDNNLLDMSYASYLNNTNRGNAEDNIEHLYKNFIEYKAYADMYPSVANYYPESEFLFDVCVETYCSEQFIGLTEKSIKPFLWGHIPVLYSAKGTYRYLEDLGFDVFRDILDLGFDNETDNTIRMWRFQQEILRLSRIDNSAYDLDMLHSRFINNRNCYIKNVKKSIQALVWIDQETNFIFENKEQYLGF